MSLDRPYCTNLSQPTRLVHVHTLELVVQVVCNYVLPRAQNESYTYIAAQSSSRHLSFEESTKIRANYRRTPESLHHLRPHPTLAYLSRTPTLSESIQPPHSPYTVNECVHQQLKLDSHEERVVTMMHKKWCGMDEYGCNGRTIHTLRVRRLRVSSVPACARSGLFSQKFCLVSNLKLRISVLSLVE